MFIEFLDIKWYKYIYIYISQLKHANKRMEKEFEKSDPGGCSIWSTYILYNSSYTIPAELLA